MSDGIPDGIPANLGANDLRRLADAQERLAVAAERANELKGRELELRRQELTGEVAKKTFYGARKDPAVWVACSKEIVGILEADPLKALVAWEDIKDDTVFRGPDGGNMSRAHQFRRFLRQHAIPRTPEYGDARLVGVGKEDRNGPPAATLQGREHCARRAFDDVPDSRTDNEHGPPFDASCAVCATRGEREDAERRKTRTV